MTFNIKHSVSSIAVLVYLISSPVMAGAYSSWAVPTRAEIVNGGLLVSGSFGNPSTCSDSDFVFVDSTHTFFDEIYAFVVSAIASERELRFYTSSCFYVSFHGRYVSQAHTHGAYLR